MSEEIDIKEIAIFILILALVVVMGARTFNIYSESVLNQFGNSTTQNILSDNGTITTLTQTPTSFSATILNRTWLDFDGDNDYVEIGYNQDFNFSFKETIFQNGDEIILPTYDGNNYSLHPNIYYNETGWNGWKYWLVMTPYYGNNNSLENPSIVVSNDTLSWEVPAGLTNPIVNHTYFLGNEFNISCLNNYNDSRKINLADPDIVFVDGNLWVYFIVEPNTFNYSNCTDYTEEIWVINSSDGIIWNNLSRVMTVNMTNTTNTRAHFEFGSPAIIYEGGEFFMWNVNFNGDSSFGADNIIQLFNSSDGINWNAPENLSINFPDYIMPWHIDIRKNGSDYWMMYNGYTNLSKTWGNFGNYFANSSDKYSWTTYPQQLIKLNKNKSKFDSYKFYKPTFIHNETDGNITLIYSVDKYRNAKNWSYGISYATFEDIINYDSTTDEGITISLWYNSSNVSTGNKYLLGRRYDSNTPDLGIYQTSNYLRFASNEVATSSNHVNISENWEHIIAKKDNNYISIYQNGILKSLQVSSGTFDPSLEAVLNFGSYGLGLFFNGSMDNMRIYNRSLSDSEILEIYNSGRKANYSLNSTSLVFWQKLDENSGTTAYDVSGNANNGTITGATWNNDGILETLTENVDYTQSGTDFTVINFERAWEEIVGSFNFNSPQTYEADYLVSSKAEQGLGEFGNWFSIIILIGIAGFILFLVLNYLGTRSSGEVGY